MIDDLDAIRQIVLCLEQKKNQLSCENESLKQELNKLIATLGEMEQRECQLYRDLEIKGETIQNLTDEKRILENCLAQKKKELAKFAGLCEENEELKIIIKEIEDDLNNLCKQKNQAEEKVDQLKRCLAEKEVIIRRLGNKIEELDQANKNLEKSIACLTRENDMLKGELENCKECLEKHKRELESMFQKLKSSEAARQKLASDLRQLEECLDQTRDLLVQERNMNEKLEAQLKCYKEANHKLKLDNEFLQEQLSELTTKYDICANNARNQCDHLERQICELKNERKITKEENHQLRIETTNLKENLCDMERQLDTCQRNLKKTRDELNKVKREYQDFKLNMNDLREQIQGSGCGNDCGGGGGGSRRKNNCFETLQSKKMSMPFDEPPACRKNKLQNACNKKSQKRNKF